MTDRSSRRAAARGLLTQGRPEPAQRLELGTGRPLHRPGRSVTGRKDQPHHGIGGIVQSLLSNLDQARSEIRRRIVA